MRAVGIETEYGIALASGEPGNPIALSAHVVDSYRRVPSVASAPWDYGGEDPLHDARGFRQNRRDARPDQLTDAPGFDPMQGTVMRRKRRERWEDPAHLNAVLANGARLYVDHAHPEYSSPEVTNARDAVIWDRAGDAIVARALEQARADGVDMTAYKNNVDGKGASYGTHENFLVSREVPFDVLARRITAHLVTRQIYTGAGRVGRGPAGEHEGFQISQRADYIEAEIGLETTMRRPIVNTRDEPHADPHVWRRLHVIIGDANCMDVPNFLKIGTTQLVLSAIEADDARLDSLVLENPVEAVREVSYDLTLQTRLALAHGAPASALHIQRLLLDVCRDYATTSVDAQVIARWEQVLETLQRDWRAASREVEWVAKLTLLGSIRARHAHGDALLPWSDARLRAADIRWSDIDPAAGLCRKLEAAGACERIASADEIAHAVHTPPRDTRAWLRGRAVQVLGDTLDAAGWNSVVLNRADSDELEVAVLDEPLRTRHKVVDDAIAAVAP